MLLSQNSSAKIKVSDKELAIFSRQFSICINAGITVVDSLKTIFRATANDKMKAVIFNLIKSIESGQKLSRAMSNYPYIFSKLYRNLIFVGEESGTLDIMLDRNSVYIEKNNKLKQEIKGAMTYPIIIVTLTVLIIVGLFYYVVPQIKELFSGSKNDLPKLFNLLLFISDTLHTYWYYILITFAVAFIAFKKFFDTNIGQNTLDYLAINTPVVKDLFIKASMARFCRTFSVMLSSQVNFIDSIEAAAQSTNNSILEKLISNSKQSVINGLSIGAPLANQSHIPNMLVQMINIGEKSGTLDSILNKVADYYEDEVEMTSRQILTIIEPLLMVGLGAIIGFLVLALYLPIFNMANIISG